MFHIFDSNTHTLRVCCQVRAGVGDCSEEIGGGGAAHYTKRYVLHAIKASTDSTH
jgi:hypothetical protein